MGQRNTIEQDVAREQAAWSKILEVEVKLDSQPSAALTSEARGKLSRHFFGIRVIPAIIPQTFAYHEHRLKSQGPEAFLSAVNKDLPGLRTFESLTYDEQTDHRIPRMLSKIYWGAVQDGITPFPAHRHDYDQWMAVELMPIPGDRQPYRDSAVTKALGLDTRRNIRWPDLDSRLQRSKDAVQALVGVTGNRLVLPQAFHLSLLLTRDPQILSNPSVNAEWTSTHLIKDLYKPRDPNVMARIQVGRQRYGGAADMSADYPVLSPTAGFRLAIAL